MKVILLFYFFTSGYIYSQVNKSILSPVLTGTFSNNNLIYEVGKIYVLPTLLLENKNEEKVIIRDIRAYPNPVINILNIEKLDNSEIKFISVFDMFGRKVYSDTIEDNRIDLSHLSSGIYIVKLDDENYKDFKIIKK